MAALEAVQLSLFPASSSSSKFLSNQNQLASVKLNLASSAPSLSLNFPFSPLRLNNNNNPTTKPCFVLLCSAVQEDATTEEETAEQSQEPNSGNQVVLFRLPFSLTAEDIKTMLSECGTVENAELVTQRNGKSRGFGFVTMSTPEEAQAVIDKFDSYEVSGMVIRVAKKVDRADDIGAHCQVYASNLAWKVRSEDLKDFFSPDFRPLSAKIIFQTRPFKRSAGYGFVTFATKEEAEAAISAMNYKPLMDRPIQLKLSETSKREGEGREEEEEEEEVDDEDEDRSETEPSDS